MPPLILSQEMIKRHSFNDLEVPAKIVIIIFIYAFLAMVTKPYGDPFTVIKTSQNIGLYGFPFDPVSRSARAPFYYYLLFMANEHYMLLQSLIAAIDVILLAVIALRLRIKPSVFSFMLPGLYVLLTRTYVDSLTVTLLSLLVLLSLSSLKAKTLSPNTYATILTSFLLVLTRESMLLLPLLALVILVLQQSTMPMRKLLTFIAPLILGWGLGCLTYYLYVYGVGATTYSSYGLYNVRLEDFLVAYTYVFSSIIPWEVKAKDLSQYLFFIKLPGIAYTYLVFIVRAFIVMLELLISVPFIVGLIELFRVRRKDLHYATAFSFIVYGIMLAGMLFLVKQPIDFFKYICALLPFTSYLISSGLYFIERRSRILCLLIKSSYVFMLLFWTLRVFRGYYACIPH